MPTPVWAGLLKIGTDMLKRNKQVLKIFADAGITPSANTSRATTLSESQMIHVTHTIIEQRAVAAEEHEQGTSYQWVTGSLWENITRRIANQIRKSSVT